MGKTDYSGIDYGNGKTNIDFNNIRYGVIPQNEVLQFWADESEANYCYYCPFCETEIEDLDYCYRCEKEIDSYEFDCLEPYSFSYNKDGYVCQQSYDDPDIFILKSPYYSFSQFCSPCAPGAGYLMNELNDPDPNNKTYCFGHDIFENGKAPYRVFSVRTNEEVFADDENC